MLKKISLLVTVGLSLISCASNPVRNVGTPAHLKVTDLRSEYQGNMFVAQATIKSDKYFNDTTTQIYYRCVYFDKNKFVVDSGNSTWVPVLIYANQEKAVQCTTTNPSVASFHVELSSSGEASKVYVY